MRFTYVLIILLCLQSTLSNAANAVQISQQNNITTDTIAKGQEDLKVELGDAQLYLLQQKLEIENLNQRLLKSEREIEILEQKTDSISIFGQDISKSIFTNTLLVLFTLLILGLLLLSYKLKSASSAAKSAKVKLDELEIEHEQQIRNSLERDQKLRRQLQDEINRHKK